MKKLLAQDNELAHGYDLLQRFRQLLKDRDLVALEVWMHDAGKSGIPTFIGLTNGIQADPAAVKAAFVLPWSSGQLEGQVNRVKLIKRQGYGSAKFDLLRPRVLLNSTRTKVRRYVEPHPKGTVALARSLLPTIQSIAA